MSLEKVKFAAPDAGEEKKVARSSTSEKKRSAAKDVLGYVKGVQNLNVREKPSSEANVLTTIPMGTAVTVKGTLDEYYRIVTPDLTEGYVLKGFLEVRR